MDEVGAKAEFNEETVGSRCAAIIDPIDTREVEIAAYNCVWSEELFDPLT